VALEREQKSAEIVGEAEAMQEVYRLIERIGPTNKPILIQGESGTGKELVAKALHRASRLADQPMVVINCAALPESLLESELFGHEKGAFTGAVASKPGLFEVADGGTLATRPAQPGRLELAAAHSIAYWKSIRFLRFEALQNAWADATQEDCKVPARRSRTGSPSLFREAHSLKTGGEGFLYHQDSWPSNPIEQQRCH